MKYFLLMRKRIRFSFHHYNIFLIYCFLMRLWHCLWLTPSPVPLGETSKDIYNSAANIMDSHALNDGKQTLLLKATKEDTRSFSWLTERSMWCCRLELSRLRTLGVTTTRKQDLPRVVCGQGVHKAFQCSSQSSQRTHDILRKMEWLHSNIFTQSSSSSIPN